ncbi:DinB family protein [Cytophagaceae bacterium SJW1-29]|uniref:DinB family protein n=1 Tax=Salmonirosea aquatica TaxID=2654236 RepID=A0A7C9BEH9_9BACT|nr:DinB family protein [Cytophagaceae bacterium SJW1-29]
MSFIEAFQKELADESKETHRMLAIVPADKMDWQPHPKSMTIKALSTHLADIASWISAILDQDEWDLAKAEEPVDCKNAEDLLKKFDKGLSRSQEALSHASDAVLQKRWLLRAGDDVYLDIEKWEAIRHAFGQNAHHRAQLGVFLRLLDIPIPGPYGPSADEMAMMAAEEQS